MRLVTMVVSILFLLSGAAFADDMTKHGDLLVKDVWSRATPARNGVAYMTIFNQGQGMDRLVAMESTVAKKVELHTHSMKDGVMRMRRISAVEVHPGEPAVFAPGGNHVMLKGLNQKLKRGETFAVTLVFEKAGKVTVDVAVGKAGAMGIGDHTHGGPKMEHDTKKMQDHKHGS
ncbi:MAG: copper chaperone PCu(A)C [Rhodospirillaceae bacterium]|nr:copper chaperone PCu(A)C [Rhodospirillaceae bacterium]